MHDIGKISTPDRILQKPGKLTDEEFATMKKHAAEGGEIILHTFKDLDNAEFRQIAYEVARHHHEKYNGRGYRMVLRASRFRCMRELWQLPMCLMPYHKRGATGMPCR